MSFSRGLTCTVTAFHVGDPPHDGFTGPHEWMAVATTHIIDPAPDTKGLMSPEAAVYAGEVMRMIEGRASAASQPDALQAALRALLFQVKALADEGVRDASRTHPE